MTYKKDFGHNEIPSCGIFLSVSYHSPPANTTPANTQGLSRGAGAAPLLYDTVYSVSRSQSATCSSVPKTVWVPSTVWLAPTL